MHRLANKKIVLGISGGIAAYKSADLARRLIEYKAEVRVVMTENAQKFIGPLTFQAISGYPVYHQWLDAEVESGMGHIELARWADLILIAPATANIVAKLAQGIADDLLSTLCLASEATIALAPAMNQQMWQAPAVQNNVNILKQRGLTILGPGEGDQACGETGPGRMLEPLQICEQLPTLFNHGPWSQYKVVITAGPTWEAIDPVRGITNHSSGKMGYAVALAAAQAGAKVVLISGPTSLEKPTGADRIDVTSAEHMYREALAQCQDADVFIGVAAVADYRPVEAQKQKIKKDQQRMTIELVKNPDILAAVASISEGPYTVGFAAETQKIEQYARKKLLEKGVDLIAANDVSGDTGFGSDENSLLLVDRYQVKPMPKTSKKTLAQELIKEIDIRLNAIDTSQDSRQAHR